MEQAEEDDVLLEKGAAEMRGMFLEEWPGAVAEIRGGEARAPEAFTSENGESTNGD